MKVILTTTYNGEVSGGRTGADIAPSAPVARLLARDNIEAVTIHRVLDDGTTVDDRYEQVES